MAAIRRTALSALADVVRSAAFARAYTFAALAAAFGNAAIHRANGPITMGAIVAMLAAIGILILVSRRDELSVIGFAPSTLVLFVVWALVSVAWTLPSTRGHVIAAWIALAGWAVIGVTIAHIRDTLQIARAIGDVLRALLSLSLALEVLSGIIFDTPFPFLGISGDLALGGPIQGIFVSRNLLGFVAVLALVAFVIEWRSRSVTGVTAVYSIALAGLLVVFSGSPTALVVLVVLAVATVALTVARRTPPVRRRGTHLTIAALAGFALLVAYVLRNPIIWFLAERSGFAARADLWNQILDWSTYQPITGWGWFGSWDDASFPTNVIDYALGTANGSALSSFFDVLLQLGWVGLALFVVLFGTALVRAWLAAADRRSVVYAWLPLTIIALAVESVFESYTLANLGWVLLVICAVRAGQERSWRTRIDPAAPLPLPPGIPPASPQGPRATDG
ncbi:O-antigen ligase family protein [Microbacterium indicum]|uniref:O-antigen ligase family protein n=1 Tax=Microbacterium indicum TaxID=358100 RepID=UPI0004039C55|nr:O-antigen ligase family protein [Microbacterium indicum]